jgi:hypothetical protein
MSLLRRMKVRRILREENERLVSPSQIWYEYGCEVDGKVVCVYPSQAAMENDPIFGRHGDAHSVARGRCGPAATPWRPVFAGDLATHRYQAGSED